MKMKFLCGQCGKLRLLKVFGSVSETVTGSRQWTRPNSNDTIGMNKSLLKSSAQILWDYLRIDNPLKKSDVIIVLGNSDLRTADYAAKLYHDGLAPLLVVSGKEGHCTKGKWSKPEAVVFAEKLIQNQVPSRSILLEPKATNTGENIRFSQKLLTDHPDLLQPHSVILVQTPFMGRRSLATFCRQWDKADQVDVMVTSPPIPLDQYPSRAAGYGSLQEMAVEMVRNMRRIEEYPNLGFQVPQHVPTHVEEAFRHLLSSLGDHKL